MKRILLETSFSKIYIIVMILISMLLVGGYFSYAMFTVSKEKSNAISIVTGNLSAKITINSQEALVKADSPYTITVPISDGTNGFDVEVENLNNIPTRINFYYFYEGEFPNNSTIGYVKNNYNIPPGANGKILEANGTAGSKDSYQIKFYNSGYGGNIRFGLSIGLDYNDLPLPENAHSFEPYSLSVAGTLLENIPQESLYDDGEYTFIIGENPNNYIWYSGKLWRAVSIDSRDNSVKLVTQWAISSIAYNARNNTNFENSYMEEWLNDTSEDGFLENLREPEKFIKMDSKWNAIEMQDASKPPQTTMVEAPVGLLTLYEYTMSYNGTDYSSGYLNNGNNWWTITSDNNKMSVINEMGKEITIYGPSSSFGIRPAINIKPGVKVASGSGTEDDPYRLEGDNDNNLSGTLLNTRYSGEYIRFGNNENNLYRIVSHEVEGLTKITSYEPLKNNGEFETISYEDGMKYSINTIVGKFLNTDYLSATNGYLTNTQIAMIEDDTIWYLGAVGAGANYKLAKYTNTDMTSYVTNTTAKIGLVRYGELMAGQFNRYNENIIYGTLTDVDDIYLRVISEDSNAYDYYNATYLYGVKPTLNLKSNVIITGGNGTLQNPFELSLK